MGYESEIDSEAPLIPDASGSSAQPCEGAMKTDWISKRYLIAILAFFGFANVYALRVNLSVAIVVMTSNYTTSGPHGPVENKPEFDWSRQMQGSILSAFFYGYIMSQVVGGWLACQYGGVRLLGGSVMLTATLSLLTPWAARTSVYLLMATRLLEGVLQGVSYPAVMGIWSRWAPPSDRSRLLTITLSGSYFGTVAAMAVSGAVAEHLKWPAIFYLTGLVAVLWSFLWLVLVRETPVDDPWVSQEERRYIQESLGHGRQAQRPEVPWKCVLSCVPLWAIVTAHFCQNWSFYTLLTELPTFMNDMYHMKVSSGSLLGSLPYLVMGIVVQASGYVADRAHNRSGPDSDIKTRKTYTTVGFLCQGLLLMMVADCPNSVLTIALLSVSFGFGGLAWSGFSVSLLEIAPQFASVLMGISNTVATLPGLLSPPLTSYLTRDQTQSEWRHVFYICGGFCTLGMFGFLRFGSSSVQSWAVAQDERTSILSGSQPASAEDPMSVNVTASNDYQSIKEE